MKYLVTKIEIFYSDKKKIFLNNVKEATEDIERYRDEINKKYGSDHVLFVYSEK